jgi:single-stranded DNA-binding protein
MESNKFELTGRVNFKDLQKTQTGKSIAKILLSKRKASEDSVEYQSYNIVFFGNAAEKAETLEKGDLIHVEGNLSTSKYEKDGKQVERMQLIGSDFQHIEYDEKKKAYKVVTKIDVDEFPFG